MGTLIVTTELSSNKFDLILIWYLTMNYHCTHVLVLSTTWNDMLCSFVDDVSAWQGFLLAFKLLRTHFNWWIVRTQNAWKTSRNIFRKAKLHFQILLLLSSPSLVKLPNFSAKKCCYKHFKAFKFSQSL